jgi:hypothetical protein
MPDEYVDVTDILARVDAFDAAPPATGEYVALNDAIRSMRLILGSHTDVPWLEAKFRAACTPRPNPPGTVAVNRDDLARILDPPDEGGIHMPKLAEARDRLRAALAAAPTDTA